MTLGRVEPRSGEIKIAAPVPGRIADVLVKANEDVFAGELLVRLDDEEALARVAEADAQVALHKRARNDQSTPAGSADRRKAEDAVADSERSVADAQSALDKVTADWRAGSASKADLDAARASFVAHAEIVCANSRKRSPSSRQPLTRHCRPDWRASSMWPRPNGHWRRRSSKRRESARRSTASSCRSTPRKANWRCRRRQPAMLVMGDLSALRVRAEVDQQYLGKIRVGQSVVVRAAAFRGRDFDGKVSSIARIVGPSRINSGDPRKFNDVDVLEVVVDLPDPGPLVVGEQVDVYFKSDQAETQ